MLTWDDEVTPSPQRTHTPPASNSPSGVTASPSLATIVPSSSAAALSASPAAASAAMAAAQAGALASSRAQALASAAVAGQNLPAVLSLAAPAFAQSGGIRSDQRISDQTAAAIYQPRPMVTLTHPDWSRNAVIYQLNTRQFTPEGTFRAAQAQLPRLKTLGIDVIWLMPIHPIGVTGRKGSLGSRMKLVIDAIDQPAPGQTGIIGRLSAMGITQVDPLVAGEIGVQGYFHQPGLGSDEGLGEASHRLGVDTAVDFDDAQAPDTLGNQHAPVRQESHGPGVLQAFAEDFDTVVLGQQRRADEQGA